MEALLHHLKDYGITELSFIIVNSRPAHSQDAIHKLKGAVSFPVYQETDDEQVWNVMEGGKDDMFVYDKCGRLTYFIPYPLSIIHEDQPIVQAAVLSTYFQSPCGTDCSGNSTFTNTALDEEIPEEAILQNSNSTSEHVKIEDDFAIISSQNSSSTLPEESTPSSVTEYFGVFENFENGSIDGNFTDPDEAGEFSNSTTDADLRETKQEGIFSSLMNLIFSFRHHQVDDNSTEDSVNQTKGTLGGTSAINDTKNGPMTEVDEPETSLTDATNDSDLNEKNGDDVKRDECVSFDEKVCSEWSKRRLLQAQRCCASLTEYGQMEATSENRNRHNHQSCKNYGKKRCKKMRPLLKCCLKPKAEAPSVAAEDEVKLEKT